MKLKPTPTLRCSKHIFPPRGTSYACMKPVKVTVAGKCYCAQHDPTAVAKREAARTARWDAASEARRRRWAVEAARTKVVEAAVAAGEDGFKEEALWDAVDELNRLTKKGL